MPPVKPKDNDLCYPEGTLILMKSLLTSLSGFGKMKLSCQSPDEMKGGEKMKKQISPGVAIAAIVIVIVLAVGIFFLRERQVAKKLDYGSTPEMPQAMKEIMKIQGGGQAPGAAKPPAGPSQGGQ